MSIYQALAELQEKSEPAVLCTVVRSQGSTPRRTGSKMLIFSDGSTAGTIGGGELENRVVEAGLRSLIDGKPRLLEYDMSDPAKGDPGVCGGHMEVFVDPVLPRTTIVVIGAGHVGQAVAHLAKWLGFRVVVSDDRTEFCNLTTVPDADELYPLKMSELPGHLLITPTTYFVLTTRNVDIDVEGLPSILATPAGYIGVIGSKRRWKTTYDELRKKGVEVESLSKVQSPMGLEINAETPEEIAISILAEIILIKGKDNLSGISRSTVLKNEGDKK